MSRSGNSDLLTEAVLATDLPSLLKDYYPDSKAIPGRAGLYFASWRGNTDTPAFSVSKKQGRWLWKDHATGEGGGAFEFMTHIVGLDRQDAAHTLIDRAGLSRDTSPDAPRSSSNDKGGSTYRPLSPEALQALSGLPLGLVEPMKGRGFTKELIEHYGIKADGEDALIPITSPDGVVMQVKRRLAKVEGSGKYRYEHKGHGGPPWCSDNIRYATHLWVIEGELSAIIAHAALQAAGHTDIGVMGVAGAKSPLYPGACKGKRVFIYADDDKAGHEAKEAWALAAHEEGAYSVHVAPPYSRDFCDEAGKNGIGILADLLDGLRAASEQAYGATDRMLGSMTVREILDRTDKYLDGGVSNPTGFREFDRETGGIRESGIYAIAGLSSMGKSSVMRYALLNHVRHGGTVKVYSPDQAPPAVYRLLTNLLSGVGVQEVRKNAYTREALALWGSPDKARQAWRETFEFVLNEIAPKFQVSEESRPREIVKDMIRSAGEGVTMFGLDYMQMMNQGFDDGEQTNEFMAASQSLGIPILAAMQLAKYKYPPTRVSGIPTLSDIEGSGKYFQNSEMVLLVYNNEIYRQKYAGEKWEPTDDSPGEGRLIVAKDKEGEGYSYSHIAWHARLAAYTSIGSFNLKREREGLME